MIPLIAILLCMLLCGCTPAELPQTTAPPPAAISQRFGLDALEVGQACRAEPFRDSLILVSGEALTKLDGDFFPSAQRSLTGQAVLIQEDVLALWQPDTRELTILDDALQDQRTLHLPKESSGAPLLSQDGQTVYYCTDYALYGWDLSSGIRRRIQDFPRPGQALIALHQKDSLLQLQCEDGSTVFLQTENGLQEARFPGEITLQTQADQFFAVFPQGFRQTLVFGTQDAPRQLLPQNLWAQGTFLPQLNAAITTHAQEDGVVLEAYSLSSGQILDTLTLPQAPLDLAVWQGAAVLLVPDPQSGENLLLFWRLPKSSQGSQYIEPYYTGSAPNSPGLTVCQSKANALSQKYGIRIKIWQEAVETQPWDYSFQPEHLYRPLLEALLELDALLGQYPQDMLRDTAAHFDSLSLCLVRSVHPAADSSLQSAATGIQFLDGGDAYAVAALGPYFRQAVYHELFHMMETHIFTGSKALDHWDSLNPAGFAYDYDFTANAQRNSGIYLEGVHRAFVDTYSMSYPKEDRARIFEYAMLPGKEELFSPPYMQKKLSALCQGIREAYHLKQEDPYPWEQYLD